MSEDDKNTGRALGCLVAIPAFIGYFWAQRYFSSIGDGSLAEAAGPCVYIIIALTIIIGVSSLYDKIKSR